MNVKIQTKPLILGGFMGLMMLGMVHIMLTSDSSLAGMALVGFLGAHVALVAALAGLGWWAARFSPALQARLSRLHKPDGAHVATMLAAAASVATAVHLFMHGGL